MTLPHFRKPVRLGLPSRRSSRSLNFESLENRLVLATVPAGFTDTQVYSGASVTAIQFDDTGRGWVGFDDGRIGIMENDVMVERNAFDLNAETMTDLGLLGFELDKDFETNGYIYVGYAADDAEPNAKFSRLQVDLTTGNTILQDSETVLLELPNFTELGNPTSHIVGAIHHAADGTLYLQVGDSQLRAPSQDLNSPLGKVLRINTDGTPASDNPYYDASDGLDWVDYVWASGLRNPFAGDIDPVTGRYFISDVGSDNWEEINDATLPGLNFGWPEEEGPSGNVSFTDPFYAYTHDNGCAITGGTFYNGVAQQFPAEYEGLYFFSEFCEGEIRVIDPDNPANVAVFATDIISPLNIAFSPDGSMYYIAYNDEAIHKVQYTLDSPPTILQQPADVLVSVDGEASFTASVGGTSPFTYQWQVDAGSGFSDIPGAEAAELMLENLTLAEDGNQYRVIVSNAFDTVTSDAATLTVTTDQPPVLSMTLVSTSGSTYRGGDTLTFSGVADDAEDGILPPESLSWKVDFHHNVHTHPVIDSLEGVSSSQIVVPTTGETDPDVWFRVYLTATDSSGLESTTFLEIFPELSDFSVEATGPVDTLFVDSQTEANPVAKTGVEGVRRTLSVSESEATSTGTAYFLQWVDGSTSRVRSITTPMDDTAYVALYGVTAADTQSEFLSDMTPVGTPINGWGPIELDMSNGGQQAGDGTTIRINGVSYEKGLGVHADSEVIYDLNSEYEIFSADIGLNAGPRDTGELIFEVYGDDALLFSSGIMTGNSATQSINVDVAGVDQLRLVVDGNGSINHDTANWADARVTKILSTFDYVSDLTPVGTPINGWGPIEIDMSTGGQGQGDGGTLKLNGVNYEKGLGVHADSEVVYALDGNYSRFTADIGLNAGPRETGEVIFEVYGDDELLFSSGIMTGNSATQSVDVDVTGYDQLRLVVDGNGSINHDTANWADAKLSRTPSEKQYLSDLPTVGTPINGWGPIELDMSNGGQAQGDGGTLKLNGVNYEKGLGVHANSEVIYALNGTYSRFVSDIGLNAGPRETGEVIFEVYGDDQLLFSSGVMTGSSATQTVDIDMTGIDELRLVVDSNGSINHDTANWADAHLLGVSSGGVDGIRGITVTSNGLLLKMLPYEGADATLDAVLDEDDINAVVEGWGQQPVDGSFEEWITAGDFNLDGVTDEFDWEILNAKWLETYGVSLDIADFFTEQTVFLSDLTPLVVTADESVSLSTTELDTRNEAAEIETNAADLVAQPELVFDLSDEDYQRLLTVVDPPATGEVVYEIYGDGALLYSSGVMTAGFSPSQNVSVDVVGIDQLRLVVVGSDAAAEDSAVWVQARLNWLSPKQILLGDFDSNGTINGFDFLAWQRGFGSSSPLAGKGDGDADFDGDVDADDLTLWQDAYGSSVVVDPQAPASSEPLSPSIEQVSLEVAPTDANDVGVLSVASIPVASTLPLSVTVEAYLAEVSSPAGRATSTDRLSGFLDLATMEQLFSTGSLAERPVGLLPRLDSKDLGEYDSSILSEEGPILAIEPYESSIRLYDEVFASGEIDSSSRADRLMSCAFESLENILRQHGSLDGEATLEELFRTDKF